MVLCTVDPFNPLIALIVFNQQVESVYRAERLSTGTTCRCRSGFSIEQMAGLSSRALYVMNIRGIYTADSHRCSTMGSRPHRLRSPYPVRCPIRAILPLSNSSTQTIHLCRTKELSSVPSFTHNLYQRGAIWGSRREPLVSAHR